jgi:hypothetical protein
MQSARTRGFSSLRRFGERRLQSEFGPISAAIRAGFRRTQPPPDAARNQAVTPEALQ